VLKRGNATPLKPCEMIAFSTVKNPLVFECSERNCRKKADESRKMVGRVFDSVPQPTTPSIQSVMLRELSQTAPKEQRLNLGTATWATIVYIRSFDVKRATLLWLAWSRWTGFTKQMTMKMRLVVVFK
jgi:hypothetical protein